MLRLYVDTVINREVPDKQDEVARWLQNIKEKGTPAIVRSTFAEVVRGQKGI